MSLRFKLTTVAVAVIVVANSLLSFLALQYLGHIWLNEVQTRVQRNLNSARSAYQKHIELIVASLQAAALDQTLIAAVGRGDRAELKQTLQAFHATGRMDFVGVLDPVGKVICRAGSEERGDDLSSDPLVVQAIEARTPAGGTVILPQQRLSAEGPELAGQARFEAIPTPAARPTDDRIRTDGMVLAGAAPVANREGELVAMLYGGKLLNRRYELVDAIKREVFFGGTRIERRHLPGEIHDARAAVSTAAVPGSWEELKQRKRQTADHLERRFLVAALERCDQNVTQAAESVGMQRTHFHALLRSHGLKAGAPSEGPTEALGES